MALLFDQYLSSVVLLGLGIVTVMAFVILNRILSPKRDKSLEIEGLNSFIAYECGEVPIGEAQTRFNFQYYVFALIFVIFDVVTSFLLAWAVSLKNLRDGDNITFVFQSATLFLSFLLIGFFFWWKRDALRWM